MIERKKKRKKKEILKVLTQNEKMKDIQVLYIFSLLVTLFSILKLSFQVKGKTKVSA